MSALMSVPAGRCVRRSLQENWVDPQPEKGSIELKYEDDLLHLCALSDSILSLHSLMKLAGWKNRVSDAAEDVRNDNSGIGHAHTD
jgi:hypothetical protein